MDEKLSDLEWWKEELEVIKYDRQVSEPYARLELIERVKKIIVILEGLDNG